MFVTLAAGVPTSSTRKNKKRHSSSSQNFAARRRSRLIDSKVVLMLRPIIAITHSGSKAIIAVPRAYRGSLLGCDDVFHLRCILFFLPYSNNRRARDVFPPLRLLSFLAPARGRKRGNPATLNTISNYVASNQIYGQEHRGASPCDSTGGRLAA